MLRILIWHLFFRDLSQSEKLSKIKLPSKQTFESNLSLSGKQESARIEKLNRMILKLAENRKEDSEVIEDLNQSFTTISTRVSSRLEFQVHIQTKKKFTTGRKYILTLYFHISSC